MPLYFHLVVASGHYMFIISTHNHPTTRIKLSKFHKCIKYTIFDKYQLQQITKKPHPQFNFIPTQSNMLLIVNPNFNHMGTKKHWLNQDKWVNKWEKTTYEIRVCEAIVPWKLLAFKALEIDTHIHTFGINKSGGNYVECRLRWI